MTRLADAEKLPGNTHWTVYDGRGGVYRAKRDTSTGYWSAYEQNGTGYARGRTLREVRAKLARD